MPTLRNVVKTYHKGTCRVCEEDTERSRTCPLCRQAQSMSIAQLEPFYTYVSRIDAAHDPQSLRARRALDLMIAHRQGRLPPDMAAALGVDPPAGKCGTCGMYHATTTAALECCADMVEVSEAKRRLLRVEQEWTLA